MQRRIHLNPTLDNSGERFLNNLALSTAFKFGCFLGFIVPLENFSLIWRRHHNRWRAANFAHARHSLPLSSEGSLACHTSSDTGHPYIMVISDDHWYSHLLPFSSRAVTTCFYDLGPSRLGFEHPTLGKSRLGFEHPTFRFRGERASPLRNHRGNRIWILCGAAVQSMRGSWCTTRLQSSQEDETASNFVTLL